MAYTTINKSTDHFNTKLYTGNGSTNAQTGVGFQPDWLWVKCRSDANGSQLFDVLRTTYSLSTNATDAQANRASDGFTSLDSDGFTMNGSGSGGSTNVSGRTYVGWNWKAGGGQGSSNTDGSINTTYTSVNTTAGFSISKYTGTGNAGTVGHGLGVAPKVIIIKNISQDTDWVFGHQELDASAPWTKYLELNSTVAVLDNTVFNDTAPTNSVFSVGGDGKVSSGAGSHVAYCFAEKPGYSKFGSYSGNSNANGPFVYTGFSPSFVMTKRTDSTSDWLICDNKRPGYNVINKKLFPNTSGTEDSYDSFDFVSNGFKIRSSGTGHNANGGTFIYMAFAEAPLVGSNNIPCTAR